MGTLAGIVHDVLEEWRIADVVVQQMTVTYTRHDGQNVTIPACNVLRLDGELIVDYHIYADHARGRHAGAEVEFAPLITEHP